MRVNTGDAPTFVGLCLHHPLPCFVDAFTERVHQYQDRIYGFACAYLKDDAAAKDVTQDVFIRYWNHYDDVDDERAIAWLMRVTRNACIDLLRKRQTRRKSVTVDSENLHRAPDAEADPYADTESADFETRLDAALAEIDEPYRSVVTMRELHNMKYKEISDALDMPINTVKVYIHRGRKKLRHELAEVLDYEPT